MSSLEPLVSSTTQSSDSPKLTLARENTLPDMENIFWEKTMEINQCFQWKTCVPQEIHLNNWLVFDEFHADCHDLLQSLHPAHSISIIIADNLMDLVHRLGSHRKDEPPDSGFPC